ncbi:predicted protein [Histoplasma capsulatum var. duboisii H88]|uniref:Predicted protein n=1 Tax=Ajellomyces capsulatus (strain H88) TaxID=544711 RepID=F0UGX1_AJEC8|nr:predicted protein [Histoplasma capsulatum var. duboisii H88]
MAKGRWRTKDKGHSKLKQAVTVPPQLDMEIGIAGRAGSVGSSASCGPAWGKERLVGVNWYGVKAAGTFASTESTLMRLCDQATGEWAQRVPNFSVYLQKHGISLTRQEKAIA